MTNRFLFALCGLTFAIPGVFFGYLTFRLLYLVLLAENGEMYRTKETIFAGMAFPVMCGGLIWLARYFFRLAAASQNRLA